MVPTLTFYETFKVAVCLIKIRDVNIKLYLQSVTCNALTFGL